MTTAFMVAGEIKKRLINAATPRHSTRWIAISGQVVVRISVDKVRLGLLWGV